MVGLNAPVLVLSSSYEAVHICSVRRALLLLLCGKAHSVEKTEFLIHSPSIQVPVPEVIRLHRFIRLPYEKVPFCRKNILMRDGYRCQYCAKKQSGDQLTVDHIVPQSRGGKDVWSNVATACRNCNNAKGNRTPEECDMKLLNPPRMPTSMTFLHIMRQLGENHQGWRKYLFFEQNLDLISRGH